MLNKEKTYYDFSDVLIKPNKSDIDSRQQINLTIANTENQLMAEWNPIPVMSANMDTVTGAELAWELLQRNWIPILHKYVSKSEISDLFDKIDEHNKINENKIDYRNLFISRGTSELDKEKLNDRLIAEPRIQSVCIDVANGHRTSVLDYIKTLKETTCKDKILMLGNIGSSDMVEEYIKVGVDIIKAGIGPGCFHEDTMVLTDKGTKKISDIKIGEHVFTYKNRVREVTGLSTYKEKDKLISINNIRSTLSHKYLVINKENKDNFNYSTFKQLSFWIEAEHINKAKHLLVKLGYITEEILSIEENSFLGLVYDIEVEEDHSFCLESEVIVHNSACHTRVKTGVGTPQISLIDEIREEIIKLNATNKILLTSDGGCKNEGDIAKGFVAGADFVMIGGMLAGYKESPGEIEEMIVNSEKKKFKRFSGMAAKESQHGGVPSHGTEEGKTVRIPYKGKIYHKLNDIEGGLRSACTYTNSNDIQDLIKAELIISTVQENKIFD